ncbi:CLUMA_CG003367, isoform A [Clunio marinus]|uniref:CLUMA_CG003367, isoform A n=1 Tax=Clunio marinus TaxID=568069 RepID=A0A1J1HTL4_9DIPT|nr:CLUMA_CG003367, isoform A [Clunio marinus]
MKAQSFNITLRKMLENFLLSIHRHNRMKKLFVISHPQHSRKKSRRVTTHKGMLHNLLLFFYILFVDVFRELHSQQKISM